MIQPEARRKFLEPAFGLLPQSRDSNAMINSGSKGLRFSCAPGTSQEVRHVRVLGSVARPPLRGRVPAIVASRHIDTVVNQELRRFILPSDGAFVKDASRLVCAPVRIDVGSVLQQKIRNLELAIHARPSQRDVQDVLGVRGHPMKIPEPGRIVDGVMLTEAPEPGTAGLIKPTPDSREVPYAGRVGEIVGQRLNLNQ